MRLNQAKNSVQRSNVGTQRAAKALSPIQRGPLRRLTFPPGRDSGPGHTPCTTLHRIPTPPPTGCPVRGGFTHDSGPHRAGTAPGTPAAILDPASTPGRSRATVQRAACSRLETRCCCCGCRACCCCGSTRGSCWSCCSSCRRATHGQSRLRIAASVSISGSPARASTAVTTRALDACCACPIHAASRERTVAAASSPRRAA